MLVGLISSLAWGNRGAGDTRRFSLFDLPGIALLCGAIARYYLGTDLFSRGNLCPSKAVSIKVGFLVAGRGGHSDGLCDRGETPLSLLRSNFPGLCFSHQGGQGNAISMVSMGSRRRLRVSAPHPKPLPDGASAVSGVGCRGRAPTISSAANCAAANGKYFVQTTVIKDRPDSVNPARAESFFRYAQETGGELPFSIEEMSQHWKARFIETVQADPGTWVHLLLRKFYYSLNDFEQYNNLTYDFHKARWSLLRWNPLGWGVLLLAAVAAVGFGQAPRNALLGGLLLAVAYGLSLVLFYASARFRLPLVPFLAVAAGGLVLLPSQFPAGLRRTRVMGTSAGLILAAIITFSTWADVDDRSTHVQDSMLLGNAATTVGDDRLAMEMADRALTLDESRDDARRLALVSYWNLRLTGVSAWAPYGDWSDTFASWIEGTPVQFARPGRSQLPSEPCSGTLAEGKSPGRSGQKPRPRHPDQRAVLDQLLAATDPASKHSADPALRKLLAPPPPTQ